jgi:riboflavin synthase
MFSGIVRGVGRVSRSVDVAGDRQLTIDHAGIALGPLEPGASVAVNGVCLTATACRPDGFDADVSAATLAVTTLGGFAAGSLVNLEPALRLGDSMDGHWVTGHVDGTGRIAGLRQAGQSTVLSIELPAELRRYVARKGSIAVDGVSLTVNAAAGSRFEVNVIPHTFMKTLISTYRRDTAVNIEVDIVARYIERLVQGERNTLGLETLEAYGYLSEN